MHPQLYPWQLLSVIVAGIINDQQQRVIEYLMEENRVLREQIGSKQIRLTNADDLRFLAKHSVERCSLKFAQLSRQIRSCGGIGI